jgi:hypothetical protein
MAQQSKPLRSAFSLFRPSVEALRQNIWLYLLLIVLPSLLITIGSPSDTESLDSYPFLIATGSILTLVFYPAVTYAYLHAAKGEVVSFRNAFSSKSYDKFWRLLGLGILVSVVVILGLIAFIVPGIIFIRRYFLASYYVMDRDMNILDAMRASAKESKQFSGAVYGVLGVVLLIAMLSIFSLPGLVASAILTILYATAPALRYLDIKKAAQS